MLISGILKFRKRDICMWLIPCFPSSYGEDTRQRFHLQMECLFHIWVIFFKLSHVVLATYQCHYCVRYLNLLFAIYWSDITCQIVGKDNQMSVKGREFEENINNMRWIDPCRPWILHSDSDSESSGMSTKINYVILVISDRISRLILQALTRNVIKILYFLIYYVDMLYGILDFKREIGTSAEIRTSDFVFKSRSRLEFVS